MIRALMLSLVMAVTASHLGLLSSDSAALSPTSLAEEYAKQLPKLGSLMPKELLREHIRRDLMPRLMATEDDKTAYELSLNLMHKLGSRTPSLLELNNRMETNAKISKHEARELTEWSDDVTRDLELLGSKVQDDGKSNSATYNSLKLLANSAQGYACAYKATELDILSKGTVAKKDCVMPFPGSFMMLEQKVNVPEKLNIILPPKEDANYLKPQEWMGQHLRRMIWCPDSFETHGFDSDSVCDAISAAFDMPKSDDIAEERSALLQLKEAKAEGKAQPAAVVPPEIVPAVGAAVLLEEKQQEQLQTAASSGQSIEQQLKANMAKSQDMVHKNHQLENKLNLLRKKVKLAKLKNSLAEKKTRLSMM